MYVYKVTNNANNKIYIGQTIRSIEQRFKRHINDAINNITDTHFARAIRKYGSDNFQIELIDTAMNQEELTLKEQQWIRYYNSTNPKYGYNETDAIYKSGGNTYQNKTPNEMNNISQKIRETKIGGLNPNSRKIKCLNINTQQEIVFDSLSLCKQYFNKTNHRFISTRVTHQTRSLYKGEWAIAYYEDKYYNFSEIRFHRSGLMFNVLDKSNNSNMIFSSITQMSKELELDRHTLGKLLKSKSSINLKKYIISVLN